MLRRMLDNTIYVTGFLILIAFIGAFLIGYTIIHSISRISRTARRIVDGDFAERVPIRVNDADEMNQLADDLNHMLDRIEALITSQRQVTNNIAHDLRSPLNRLRNRMEVGTALTAAATPKPCATLSPTPSKTPKTCSKPSTPSSASRKSKAAPKTTSPTPA